jgi:hypothetical protein
MMTFFEIAHAVTISPAIPGVNQNGANASPGAWISNFYQFALLISGILAFGAIVFGGVKSAISAGNPSAISEARQWIWSALIGLLLLGGAYIILNTINPNLINLNLPTLSPIDTQSGVQGGNCTSPSFSCGTICCYPGQQCASSPTGAPYCSGNSTSPTPKPIGNPIIVNPNPGDVILK